MGIRYKHITFVCVKCADSQEILYQFDPPIPNPVCVKCGEATEEQRIKEDRVLHGNAQGPRYSGPNSFPPVIKDWMNKRGQQIHKTGK